MMVMSVSAQSLAEQPQMGFQSTSSMVGSGSTLPQAATEGAYTTYDEGGITRNNAPGIRRIGGGNSGGGSGPSNPDDPYGTPIGDGIWALLALAAGYAVFRIRRKCKQVA